MSAFRVQPLDRLLLLAVLLAGLAGAGYARAATCTSVANGNWNQLATWGPGGCPGAVGGIPNFDDDAIIATNVDITASVTVNALTVNAGGTLTVTVNNRNLIVNTTTSVSGTLALTATGGTKRFSGLVTINAGGSMTVGGNNNINFRGAAAGGGIVNNSGNLVFLGNGNATFDNTNFDFTIGGDSPIAFGGQVTVAAGDTLNQSNTSTVAIGGNLNGSGTSTWNITGVNARLDYGGADDPMDTGQFNADLVNNTVNYGRAGNQTVKTGTYRNLILGGPLLGVFTASGTKTAQGALTVNGDLTLGGPDLATDGTATFNAGTFTHTLNGSFIINTSAATPVTLSGNSHFIFNAPFAGPAPTTMGGLTGAAIRFADVTINNASGVTFNDSADFSFGTTPTLTVSANATLTPAADAIIDGNAASTLTGSGTVQVTRTAVQGTPDFVSQYTIEGPGNVVYANLTVDYAASADQTVNNLPYGTLFLTGSGTKTMPGTAMTVSNRFLIGNTAVATAGAAMTVGGNFDIRDTSSFTAGAFTHDVGGDFSQTSTATFNAANSTFNFNGSAAQAITGTAPITFHHLTISNTSAAVTPSVIVEANGNISNSGTLGGTVRLNGGTAAHQLSGTGAYNNLRLNDAQGALLTGSPTVNGQLRLNNGLITTGGINTLIIGTAGTITNASATSHVVGNLAKDFSATGSFTYAVGDGTRYTPVDVTFTALPTPGRMTVSATAGDHPDTTAESSSLDPSKSVNRYWTIKNTTAVGTFDATFNYLSTDLDAGVTAASMVIARGGTCTGSGAGRSCSTTWSRPTMGGSPTTTQATATGLATGVTESDFAVGQPAPVRFSREKEFIFTRELY
jgi:hypothetical protein